MRLVHSALHPYRLPYIRPVRWSSMVESEAQFLLLRIEADSGHSGVGEAVVKPTWNGVTLRSLSAAVEDIFVPLLGAADLSDIAALRQRMNAVPDNQAAKTLIDNALWDLHAAVTGRPLWRSWHGAQEVALSWAVTRQAPRAMAEEAEAMVRRYGFCTLKVKGGQGTDVDIEAMRAIRAAVGESVALFVDANRAYSPQEAADYVMAMADAGALIVEDPCRLAPDAEFRRLQQVCKVPVLVDLDCASPRDASLFLAQGTRALSLKPGRLGLSDTRTMAAMAQAAGCTAVVGLFGESALGTLHALQLASTLPAGSLPAEISWYLAMSEQIIPDLLEIRDGKVRLPEQAGFATLIDQRRVAR